MRTSGLQTSVIISLLIAIAISVNATPLHPQRLNPKGESMRLQSTANGTEEVVYRLSPSNDVVMNLAGTTPIRDWKMSAHGLTGSAKMVTSDNNLLEIQSLTFSLPVYNLRGEERGMDNDCYAALKANRYREIVFVLISASVAQQGQHAYVIAARGTLTVAGVTQFVTLKMHSRVAENGSIIFTGMENVRMSDYNVERPSVFFGVIRAGDEMTLSYNLIFTK